MWWGGSHGDFDQVAVSWVVFLVYGEECGPHSMSGVSARCVPALIRCLRGWWVGSDRGRVLSPQGVDLRARRASCVDCLARVVQGRAGPRWAWVSHGQLCEQRTALFVPMGPSCWCFCEVRCPALFRRRIARLSGL